jgi:hypothetical protein
LETQSALRHAQSYFRLQVTGCCDAMTWQTLQTQKLATA